MTTAIIIHGAHGSSKEFVPTDNGWELRICTIAGLEPGGVWGSVDVARCVVDAIYEEDV